MGRDLAMGMPAQGRRRAPSARDEAALVRAAKRGSADAVEALVRGHWDGAHRTAFLIVRDAAAAEDIAQEAVLAAVRRIDDFDRRRPFRPWLHRIVVNRSLDWLRARQRRQDVSLDELPAAAAPDQRPAARLGARGGLALARIEAPLKLRFGEVHPRELSGSWPRASTPSQGRAAAPCRYARTVTAAGCR